MVATLVTAGSTLVDYSLLLLPGLMLIGACYWLSRADPDPVLRIVMLILGFILIRDAMTPAGLWDFGLVENAVPWIRMTDHWVILVVFGLVSLFLVATTLRDNGLRALVMWGRPNISTILFGVAGAVLAVLPIFFITAGHPIEGRGGTVAAAILPALAFMTLAGNLLEEVFFRGYLQGRLEASMTAVRAAIFSGVLFAACHSFLATTVTNVGWPLLAFTLWEGLICAFLRLRRGVIPAAIAHGLAIFLLSSGLV